MVTSQKLLTFLLGWLTIVVPSFANLSEKEATDIGIDTYIYGYPLVTMDMTREVMTNVEHPTGTTAPMGQFANLREYPTAAFKTVTTPNADTLYSIAWLDLSKEPYVLHLPDEKGRYYLMPMLSGWTEVFAAPGTRTTGTDSKDFAITGPSWSGSLPKGIKEIKSPTNMVWILGRTYSSGTKEDLNIVHKIQDQYSLRPLSAFGKSYTPPKGTFDKKIDMKTAVRDQVNSLSASQFFARFAALLKENPPGPHDGAMLDSMAKIGFIPGQDYDLSKQDPKIAKALENVPKLALEKMMAHKSASGKVVNGWLITTRAGRYGANYLQRAFIAAIGLGANLPQDAIYPSTNLDSEGKPLDGAHNYVLKFQKDKTPPVNGFWSLTMYNNQFFFVANHLNRYTLSPRNDLRYNEDGSLELYIQNMSPGGHKESNWLPAPEGKFNLVLRLYWPQDPVLGGTWVPPAVERVKNDKKPTPKG